MFGKSLTIKLRFESTNENQLTLESNLAVEVKIDSDEIKFPPNHQVSQMFDWQLVRLLLSTIFPQVVIQVNGRAKMSNAALREALGLYWYATQLDPQLKECVYQHLN